MMNESGDFMYWGMTMGGWILVLVIGVFIAGIILNVRRRRR
jgi:hypothetical protein